MGHKEDVALGVDIYRALAKLLLEDLNREGTCAECGAACGHGAASAAEKNVARQFLKDNAVDIERLLNPMQAAEVPLPRLLPFQDPTILPAARRA